MERQWSDEQCKESNAKWMAFVQQLQDDQAKRQKEVDDDHMCHEAEIEKQCAHKEEGHTEQQRRLCISQNSAQSTALYYYSSSYLLAQARMPLPHVQVHAPALLPSQLNMSPPAPPPDHPAIPVNVQPQVPVVDFVQQ